MQEPLQTKELGFARIKTPIRYSDFSGGLRLDIDPSKIRQNEVWYTKNAILHTSGIYVRPAIAGLTTFDVPGNVQGIKYFKTSDGEEYRIVVSDGKIYQSDMQTGVCIELFDVGSSSQRAYFAVANGKCFIATGGTFCKVEKISGLLYCYRVGIAAPITAAAAAAAGGSLPVGIYKVYVSYARWDGDVDLLYSQPYYIDDVELTAGNQSIAITGIENSSDPQVNDKVIWLTEPSGTVNYWYANTGDNVTESITISSAATKKTNITSGIYADQNNLPENFEYVCYSRGTIYGSKANILYYSIKNNQNSYDNERFKDGYFINYPYNILGIVRFQTDIYINTEAGIFRQPYGEPSYEYDVVSRGEYWKHIDTVKEYGGRLYGLTNFGLKIFIIDTAGARFLQVDLSDPVRKEIEILYSSSDSMGIYPCAEIFNRSIEIGFVSMNVTRVVYVLSYIDSRLGSTCNNIRLELNLNAVQILPNDKCIAPWELHEAGFDFIDLTAHGEPCFIQKNESRSVLYYENKESAIDTNVYDSNGNFQESQNIPVVVCLPVIYSGDEILIRMLDGGCRYGTYQDFQLTAVDYDAESEDAITISQLGEDVSFWDEAIWEESEWLSDLPGVKHFNFEGLLVGRNLYLKIQYDGGQPSWYITDIGTNVKYSRNRFSYAT